MQKLKVGDTVQVTAGAERTQKSNRGKILAFDKVKNRVRVEGLRMVKKHVKKGRDRANPEGGILESAGTIALASLSLVCPKCDKPTRVGLKITDRWSVSYGLQRDLDSDITLSQNLHLLYRDDCTFIDLAYVRSETFDRVLGPNEGFQIRIGLNSLGVFGGGE